MTIARHVRPKPKRSEPRRQENRDKTYRSWIAEQPCLLTGKPGHFCRTWSNKRDCAHVRTKTLGGDHMNCVPLCRLAHQEEHAIGIKSFEVKYQVDLSDEAQRLDGVYTRQHSTEGWGDGCS